MSNYQVFFAYPSKPPILRESMSAAIEQLANVENLTPVSWESLAVSGKILGSAVTGAIRAADVVVCEVTYPNPNVYFELGYAIGAQKKVWLLRDPSEEEAEKDWNTLRTLSTLGYAEYKRSFEIQTKFLVDQPHEQSDTVFSREIAPRLKPKGGTTIFYLASPHQDDASSALSRRITKEERGPTTVITADPAETPFETLPWYGERIYRADAVVVHMMPSTKTGARVSNARWALIAGLAAGMGRPLLILAQSSYESPLDFRDLVKYYETAKECQERADAWLKEVLRDALSKEGSPRIPEVLSAELRGLQLGEHVAENEAGALWDYFIETAEFNDVLRRQTLLFSGRKGTGKTANLLIAAERLREDKRNLVCVIKPAGYEFSGLVRILSRYADSDTKGYLVDRLWRLLLYSEIALAARERFASRPEWSEVGKGQAELIAYLDGEGSFLDQEFAVRLERAVEEIAQLAAEPFESVEEQRAALAHALHESRLQDLRRILGEALEPYERVAVLIDNLDKAWEKGSDLDQLSQFLLGLLTAVGHIERDFARSRDWRKAVPLTVATFLRTDILERLKEIAREPDKIAVARIEWKDRELLLRVIEERYRVTRTKDVVGSELWSRFFCEEIGGLPTHDYVVSRILPRPRDIVYLCNEAIGAAVNRGHSRVEADDIFQGERSYSQFALEAALVENHSGSEDLESAMFAFSGLSSRLTRSSVEEALRAGGVTEENLGQAIEELRDLWFLGTEVRVGEFTYTDELHQRARDDVLAARLGVHGRFEIHPAFRSFLEITEVD